MTGFFLTTKLWGGDDALIKNSWSTSYFQDSSYRVTIADMIWDEVQNEIFFELEQTKTIQDIQLKLQVDLIAKDNTVYPIQNFSHLMLEPTEEDSVIKTRYSFSIPFEDWRYIRFTIHTEREGVISNQSILYADYRELAKSETLKTRYSFSIPFEDWRYIRFTIHTEREGVISNQSILYADYRELAKSETPIILAEWLNDEAVEETENIENQEDNTSITTEETPTENIEEPERLEQEYVIESEPIILDGGGQDQSHEEIIETEEPIYTLEDYEHQQQKLNEEIANVQAQLTEQADNRELQNQLSELQKNLEEVQQKIQSLKGE